MCFPDSDYPVGLVSRKRFPDVLPNVCHAAADLLFGDRASLVLRSAVRRFGELTQ